MASEMGVDIAFINSGAIKGSFDPARRNGELYISKLISTGKENIHEYNLVTASNKINRIRKKAWQDILSQKIWVALFLFQCSDADSGWAGWALAHPEFRSSVNPIQTRGAGYAHLITAFPPGFENLAASLQCLFFTEPREVGFYP